LRLEKPYIETFGESTQQSYSIFFVIPPGGKQATFHVTLNQPNQQFLFSLKLTISLESFDLLQKLECNMVK